MKKSKEKYVEVQILQQQLEHLQKYTEALQTKQAEFAQAQETLQEFKNAKDDQETFIPVSSGIFVKAKIQDKSHLLVNVGANVAVTKTVPEVIHLLNTQITEVETLREQLGISITRLSERMDKILEELRSSE